MCETICRRVLLVSVGIVLFLGSASPGVVIVVNYDNHPDLEKAKEYDLTVDNKRFMRADGTFDQQLYKSFVAKASRELAEQHYLAYLQDVTNSFQRAAVYARLGDLFNGGTEAYVAKTIDTDKARMYYRKALEAEPERIGWATLHARGFFATDANNNGQRFASYMDYYQWLLSIDEKKLKEHWLPTQPPSKLSPAQREEEALRRQYRQFKANALARPPRPRSGSGGGMLDVIKGQADVTACNLVYEAAGRMGVDPQTGQWSEGRAIQHLIMLRERFPGTSVADRAAAELAKIAGGVADAAVQNLEPSAGIAAVGIEASSNPESQAGETPRAASTPRPENPVGSQAAEPKALADASPINAGAQSLQAACLLGLCALLVGGVLLQITRRKRHPTENHGEN